MHEVLIRRIQLSVSLELKLGEWQVYFITSILHGEAAMGTTCCM